MTDGEALTREIKESGISITHIAAKMGCSRNRIYAILNGSECTASEIVKLSEILHFDDQKRNNIFLRKNVIVYHAGSMPAL